MIFQLQFHSYKYNFHFKICWKTQCKSLSAPLKKLTNTAILQQKCSEVEEILVLLWGKRAKVRLGQEQKADLVVINVFTVPLYHGNSHMLVFILTKKENKNKKPQSQTEK